MKGWKSHCVVVTLFFVSFMLSSVSGNNLDSAKWRALVAPLSYPSPNDNLEAELYEGANEEGANAPDDESYKKQKRKKGEQYESFDEVETPQKSHKVNFDGINVVIYILLFILLAYIVYRIVSYQSGKRIIQKPKLSTQIDAENPEELIRSEIEMELLKAHSSGNFNRCLRYQFLRMLDALNQKGEIVWHKYRTNGEYIRELKDFEDLSEIKELTFIYEYYWYGEHTLSNSQYDVLAVRFLTLIELWEK